MQEKYVSLHPDFVTQKQSVLDREHVYAQRYNESMGGSFSRSVGTITGVTAASIMYARAQKQGFTGFFPLTRANATHYTFILGAGFLAYHFFSGLVYNVTGNSTQQGYLIRNKLNIVSGKAPYQLEKAE